MSAVSQEAGHLTTLHKREGCDRRSNIQQRDQILLEHLPLVEAIARRICRRLPKHIMLGDLVQAGMLGLIDASEKYDSTKHVKFGMYAKARIRGAILDSLRELDWAPRPLRKMGRQAERARSFLRSMLAREPSESEVAAKLGMPLSDFQMLRQDLDRLIVKNFHPHYDWEDRPNEFVDYPASSLEASPYHVRLLTELRDLLSTLISRLPHKQREVLNLYYKHDLTMKEVGAALGVGETRISQLHTSAISGLRAQLAEHGLGGLC